MNNQTIMIKVKNATIWSMITQIITKLFSPIINIILARLLIPETFGVIATVTIVMSFTDIIIDAGFPKYIVQHEFHNITEERDNVTVAFWSTLIIAMLLWTLIIIFQHPIATLVGNSYLSDVIVIAGIQLPINAMYSTLTAYHIRNFDNKDIFISKLAQALLPLFVTIPLAWIGLRHWSIIIGSISGTVIATAILLLKSNWKPSFTYSIKLLRSMLSFSMWTVLEGFFLWLATWVDIIIISNVFSDYYLGLYVTAYNMVNAVLSMITSAIVPILFVALSRTQNEKNLFCLIFLKYQKMIAYFLFPIGIGIYLYRDFATYIILGMNWSEASFIIGSYALTAAIKITLVNINSEAFKAIGQPKFSLFLQVLDLCILIPACVISTKYGFWSLVKVRALVRLDLIIPGLIFISIIMKHKIRRFIQNIEEPILCTIIMSFVSVGLKRINKSMYWQLSSVFLCVIIYILTILIVDRSIFVGVYRFFIKRKYKL